MGGLLNRISTQEWRWREASYDYEKRFYGHCNTTTDIKEVNFFGRLEQQRCFLQIYLNNTDLKLLILVSLL